ncbi:hypothetical protein [Streptomyces sp. NPDC051173]|uniref:hypothetical protein n=1 Tax=Streptomyces sp. NPDC051173 TaxID=3155164 RepID=UPI00344D8A37
MTALLAVAVAVAGLAAALWAADVRLSAAAARLRQARLAPAPPYAYFAPASTLRVLWADCPSCGRRHAPHEADDAVGSVRCVDCGHRRFATEGVGR